MQTPELAMNPMRKICKKAGATRISKTAAKALAKELDELGFKIAKEAIDYAKYAGRITLKAEDIEIASKKIIPQQLTPRL